VVRRYLLVEHDIEEDISETRLGSDQQLGLLRVGDRLEVKHAQPLVRELLVLHVEKLAPATK